MEDVLTGQSRREILDIQEEGDSSNQHIRTENSQAQEGSFRAMEDVLTGQSTREILDIQEEGNSSNQDSRRENLQAPESGFQAMEDVLTNQSRREILDIQEEGNSSNQHSRMENLQPQEGEDKTGEGINKVETIVSHINSRLETVPGSSTSGCIICRVPKSLREANEKAYTPLLVSIGPFHYRAKNSRPMDDLKLKYLKSFLSKSKGTLGSYVELVERRELDIRQCYANSTANIDSESFIQMVLLDSVFIIQVLRSAYPLDHLTLNPAFKMIQIERDLSLAENQLPFFILCDLYRVAFIPDRNTSVPSFTDIACRFFRVSKNRIRINNYPYEAICSHFLDMLRMHHMPSIVKRSAVWELERCLSFFCIPSKLFCLPAGKEKEEVVEGKKDEKLLTIISRSATCLNQVGIKFRAVRNAECLLDIQFNEKEGILYIPILRLDNRMEVLFKNLMAFEQCHWHCLYGAYWTHYRCFMDFLIKTPKDVKLLVEAGIIENLLGSEEDVCYLFNIAPKDIQFYPQDYHYSGISRQLNDYYKRRINHNRAVPKQKGFGHPWARISATCAFVLLLLGIARIVTGATPFPGHK